ncbi:MAG: UvrD-helicase domain-containing protein [Bacteroidia bacterium]|nr:UvrD-helicase domain-containing protein [Bacteroidia bacterium]
MNTSEFHIFNASAGSGKTYSLVRLYLNRLFSSPLQNPYRRILAITFTNKAVGEMKSRILEALKAFSAHENSKNPNDLLNLICADLKISEAELKRLSQEKLDSILHDYAAFDVLTIDKFNQKLIRTFSRD